MISYVFDDPISGVGACFYNYAPNVKSTASYGPCTETGRSNLAGVEDVDKYNTSCAGSGFEFTADAKVGPVMGIALYDGSGFIRDVQPP